MKLPEDSRLTLTQLEAHDLFNKAADSNQQLNTDRLMPRAFRAIMEQPDGQWDLRLWARDHQEALGLLANHFPRHNVSLAKNQRPVWVEIAADPEGGGAFPGRHYYASHLTAFQQGWVYETNGVWMFTLLGVRGMGEAILGQAESEERRFFGDWEAAAEAAEYEADLRSRRFVMSRHWEAGRQWHTSHRGDGILHSINPAPSVTSDVRQYQVWRSKYWRGEPRFKSGAYASVPELERYGMGNSAYVSVECPVEQSISLHYGKVLALGCALQAMRLVLRKQTIPSRKLKYEEETCD